MSTPVRRYSRGRTLVSMRDVPAATTRYYHFDHQGTVQCLTDGTGAVTDRFASDAWGVQVKRTGTSINRQWYIGRSGYYGSSADYVRARWYEAARGQWSSQDATPNDSEPRYGYGRNTPATHIDPGGNATCCCCCAESLINVGLWFFYYPPRKGTGLFTPGANGHIGWMIAIEANMGHSVNPKVSGHSQCSLAWLERTNTPPRDSLLPRNQWYDALLEIPESPVFSCWRNRKPTCPGKERVYLYDPPSDTISLGTAIDAFTSIVVTLRSGDDPNCKCAPPLQQIWFDIHTVVDKQGTVDWRRTGIWKDGSRETGLRNIGEAGLGTIALWKADHWAQESWCKTLPNL